MLARNNDAPRAAALRLRAHRRDHGAEQSRVRRAGGGLRAEARGRRRRSCAARTCCRSCARRARGIAPAPVVHPVRRQRARTRRISSTRSRAQPELALPPPVTADDTVPHHLHLGHDRLSQGRDAQPAQFRHRRARRTSRGSALQPDDRVMMVLPMFHVNALFYSIAGTLAAGCTMVLMPRFSASEFWNAAVEHGATQVNIIEAIGTHPRAPAAHGIPPRAPDHQGLRRARRHRRRRSATSSTSRTCSAASA